MLNGGYLLYYFDNNMKTGGTAMSMKVVKVIASLAQRAYQPGSPRPR